MPDLRVTPGGARFAAAPPVPAEPNRSVIIVDDEASVRHLMRRWLESRGYTVAVAPGAVKALELLAVTPTAVALCDMPCRATTACGWRTSCAANIRIRR